MFDSKSAALVNFSNRVVSTARLVATGNTSGNKKLAEALLASAGQVGNFASPVAFIQCCHCRWTA